MATKKKVAPQQDWWSRVKEWAASVPLWAWALAVLVVIILLALSS